MAAASATKEAISVCSFFSAFGCPPQQPTVLRVDNAGVIKLVENPHHHELTKHIGVRYHLIRQHITDGTVSILHTAASSRLLGMS